VRGLRFSKVTLLKVVVFALASAVLTGLLAVKIGNLRPFSHNYRLEAQFADASGVFKGDAVKLAGVDVGRVESTRIERGRAIVTFDVDESVHLTRDSYVGIRWRNLLGQRFIYLYPGDGGGAGLKDGDRIALSHTQDAGDIGQFMNELGPILKAIDPDKANAFLDAMDTALSGNEPETRQLLDDGAHLAGRLSGMDDQIKTLITSSDTVISTYASQDHAIGQILGDLDTVGARLGTMTDDINSVVTNFARVQQQFDRLITENRGNIDADLRELDSVAANLSRNRKNLAATLCSAPAGVTPYFQTTSWGEWFNVRVIGVTLKDSQGHLIAQVNELPNQRSGRSGPAYTCGGVSPTVHRGAGAEAASSKKDTAARSEREREKARRDAGFSDLGSFVRFVLGGRS
jgi:phospholipid/cholesterol/gamma-HCH transport system substrate-binding protein